MKVKTPAAILGVRGTHFAVEVPELVILRRRYLFLLMVFAFGCAQRQAFFVVLPNADGTSGAITVSDNQQSVLLDKPYAARARKKAGA